VVKEGDEDDDCDGDGDGEGKDDDDEGEAATTVDDNGLVELVVSNDMVYVLPKPCPGMVLTIDDAFDDENVDDDEGDCVALNGCDCCEPGLMVEQYV